MGAIEPPPASVNDRYFEKLARKDWLRNLQTAYFEQRVALKHARIKSHFVRYFDMTSKNVHFVEHLARQLLPAAIVAAAEAFVIERIDTSMAEIDKETVRIQGELQAEGVTALPAYVQAPLQLDARCTSPKITRYLELLLKADRLFTMLEALRLAGAITSESYDHRCAVIIARLVDVPRRALNTVVGLRKQAHRMAARAAPPTVPPATLDLAPSASVPAPATAATEAPAVDSVDVT
jgi:hypothetical protein